MVSDFIHFDSPPEGWTTLLSGPTAFISFTNVSHKVLVLHP